MGTTLFVMNGISIPLSELQFRFSRSGGHGGQNVNKVETRVELLFDVASSPSLSEAQRDTLLLHLRSQIDASGNLRIISQRSRNQWRNRQDAIERFIQLIQRALKPKTIRRATKVTRAAKEKRLEAKKRRGHVKKMRSSRED